MKYDTMTVNDGLGGKKQETDMTYPCFGLILLTSDWFPRFVFDFSSSQPIWLTANFKVLFVTVYFGYFIISFQLRNVNCIAG
jgi:hypothetical protein